MQDYGDKLTKSKRGRIDYRASILTERFLTMVLKVISNPKFSKTKYQINIEKFIESIPFNKFEKDQNVYALLMAIKIVIKNKLEGATDPQDLVEYVNIELTDNFSEIKESMIFPTILSSEEVQEKDENLVLSTINKYIRNEVIFKLKDDLSDVLTDISSGNIVNLDDSMNELETIISNMHSEFENTKNYSSGLKIFHTKNEEEFKETLKESYDYANSSKMVLKTGLKRFNRLLSTRGGFLGGNSYIFYADTNTFKSALLRYIDYWIVNYNSDMFMEEFLRTKKRPTVVFVSLEDGQKEDTNRYYSIYSKKDLAQAENFEAALKVWTECNSESIIDTTHINGGEEGVNFAVIDNVLKRLDEDGYFPIAVIVDSFDLMSPSSEDIRMRINDETQLLVNRARFLEKWISDKPFPFITAHQLNRVGNQNISEKKEQGIIDIAKTLGRSMISGSYDIERRVQWSAFIYTERSKYDNELYLEIHREKSRYKRDLEVDYLVTKLNDGFYIEDDFGTDYETCSSSIMPVIDQNTMTEVGGRGAVSINSEKNKPQNASGIKQVTPASKTKLEPIGSVITSSSVSSINLNKPENNEDNIKGFNDEDYIEDKSEGLSPFYGVLDNKDAEIDNGDIVFIQKDLH